MATTIVTKYGSDAPAASDLVRGELAVDTENGRLYTENSSGAVVEIGLNPEGNVNVTGTGSFSASAPYIDLFETDTTDLNSRIVSNSSSLRLQTVGDDGSGSINRLLIDHSTGDISFYEDTGTTAKLFWDASAERLGIGNSATDVSGTGLDDLVVGDGSAGGGIVIDSGASVDGAYAFASAGAKRGRVRYDNSTDSMHFETNNTGDKLTIDSSGNVGIGTDSPSFVTGSGLEIQRTTADATLRLEHTGANAFELSTESTQVTYNSVSSKPHVFEVGSAAKMTIAADGNVSIGTTTVNSKFNVASSQDSLKYNEGVTVFRSTGSNKMFLNCVGGGANIVGSNSPITFNYHDQTNNNVTEVMRISGSNLLVGRTSTFTFGTNTTDGIVLSPSRIDVSSASLCRISQVRNSVGTYDRFYNNAAIVGSISGTTTATAYNTSSDQRLKDNIVDAPSASDDIDAIQVRSFDWKADGSHQKYGMVAQELQTVAPKAVSGDADSEEMMGVDYSKLVPMLVKEIQSLRARVAQLES